MLSLSCQFPPTIAHWLLFATERAGTPTISQGQGDKQDAELGTLPARVTFQLGTTAGRIFAKRSVLID